MRRADIEPGDQTNYSQKRRSLRWLGSPVFTGILAVGSLIGVLVAVGNTENEPSPTKGLFTTPTLPIRPSWLVTNAETPTPIVSPTPEGTLLALPASPQPPSSSNLSLAEQQMRRNPNRFNTTPTPVPAPIR